MKKKLKVLVLFDGTSPTTVDQDFTKELKTDDWAAEAHVIDALKKLGHEVRTIGVWDEPGPRFERARALLEAADKVRAGVTLVNGIMVARLLGEATAVRTATTRFLGDFRGRRLPRVWHI